MPILIDKLIDGPCLIQKKYIWLLHFGHTAPGYWSPTLPHHLSRRCIFKTWTMHKSINIKV